MSDAKDCAGVAGWLFGHKFSAQFNNGSPAMRSLKTDGGEAEGYVRLIETTKSRTFAGALCCRCGAIVRNGSAS